MRYCEEEGFSGWDPFDGLTSPVIQKTPLGNYAAFRLAWIQFFKLSPVNFRRMFGVGKGQNSKGLALFLTGYCNLYGLEKQDQYLLRIVELADKLLECANSEFSGKCWGYNFDWQNRAFFLRQGTPTVVATSFVARSLMDAFDASSDQRYLDAALSACEFVIRDLNRFEEGNGSGFIFSYSPLDKTRVYNASLLGSYLLARGFSYNSVEEYKELALESARSCAVRQRSDGAWRYGELAVQNWVDSFHTGYNLEALHEIDRFTGESRFRDVVERGVGYYLEKFFRSDGTPAYFDSDTYPIDIHSPAQFLVTMSRLGLMSMHRNTVDRVLDWTVRNMWNSKGYFDYRIGRIFRTSIPYMRWSQAWMFYALASYFNAIGSIPNDVRESWPT